MVASFFFLSKTSAKAKELIRTILSQCWLLDMLDITPAVTAPGMLGNTQRTAQHPSNAPLSGVMATLSTRLQSGLIPAVRLVYVNLAKHSEI